MMKALKERLHFARFCILHRRSLAAQRRWQCRGLKKMVAHAYNHVPLWRTIFKEKGITPDSIRSLDDITKLPVVSKQTFLGREVEEYIDTSRRVFSAWYVTSGTSGVPFRFLMSEEAVLDTYINFTSYRFLWWLGVPLKHIDSMRLARIKIRAPQRPNRLLITVEDFLKDPREVLQRLVEFDVEIIAAYPSILLEIARLVESDPTLPRPKPRFALSFGETLFPSVRSYVSTTLGCEIYDRYGLEEIGAVGVECKMHDGLHVNTESVLIEVLHESDAVVALGGEGRIVATDLLNLGMPFIRYDSGDRGKISYESCACGLHSPRLWIKGRYSAYLSFSERRIHHLEFDGAMDGFMNYIFQYQIAKKSDSEIVARIIPGPAFYADVKEWVEESLKKLVGEDVRVVVEVVGGIPLTPRGKCRIVIDES